MKDEITSMGTLGRPVEFLLAEDNPGDVRLTREALRESNIESNLYVAKDGVEAMDFLLRRGEHANAPTPDIMLLDLNLPKMDGRQVLEAIKSNPDLRRIPVAVMTSSEAEQDVLRAYDLHANCYVCKPVDLDQFVQVIQSLEKFWLTVVKLPSSVAD